MGNILIVEDDANIRKLVTVNLEKRGYKLSEAGDGNQAMLLFRQYPFDLVLLDLVLPGLSGVMQEPMTILQNRAVMKSCSRVCAQFSAGPRRMSMKQVRKKYRSTISP